MLLLQGGNFFLLLILDFYPNLWQKIGWRFSLLWLVRMTGSIPSSGATGISSWRRGGGGGGRGVLFLKLVPRFRFPEPLPHGSPFSLLPDNRLVAVTIENKCWKLFLSVGKLKIITFFNPKDASSFSQNNFKSIYTFFWIVFFSLYGRLPFKNCPSYPQ